MKRPPKRKIALGLEAEVADKVRAAAGREFEALRSAYTAAAADQAFRADVERVMEDFSPLDDQVNAESRRAE